MGEYVEELRFTTEAREEGLSGRAGGEDEVIGVVV